MCTKPVLLKHVLQVPVLVFNIEVVLIPVDIDIYVGNSKEYIKVHVQYPYIVTIPVLYHPLMEPQLKLCT